MISYKGTPASGEIAVAKIKIVTKRATGFKRVILAPHREKALFDAALILAKDEISCLIENADKENKDIFYFQMAVLDDNGMKQKVQSYIDTGKGAAAAVELVMQEYYNRIKSIDDNYLSERSSDVCDVLTRVIDILDGKQRQRFEITEPVIIVADEILPSDMAVMERKYVKGFVTVNGSYQSHSNIIARTMGIPSVCGVNAEILNGFNDGKTIALDGYTGEVFVEPNQATLALFSHKINLCKRKYTSLDKLKKTPIYAPDRTQIKIFANCNDPIDIEKAIQLGADGIGLVRSEVLFMSNQYNLTLQGQIEYYTQCIKAAQDKEIVIRTFDVGADKPIEDLYAEKEPNPALGMRGVRLMYIKKDLLQTQIEALYISAAENRKINVMIPMVTTVEDVEYYFKIVKETKQRLFEQKIITVDNINWGVMIETPSAALISEQLAQMVSFFSIGTNDLTQYTLAVDRINTNTAMYYKPTHPSVIKLIEYTIENANKYGVKVSVCGESAADFDCAKLYVQKGVRCLSMAPNSMLAIKQHFVEEFS